MLCGMTATATRPSDHDGMHASTLQLLVLDKEQLADGVVSLVLGRAYGGRLPDWSPGSHIDLVLPNGLTRQYSLCGDRWDPTTYRVGVLREPHGHGGSAYVHDALVPGDAVSVGGPRNHFGLVPAERYLFIAGGIGITPLLPMLAQAEMLATDWTLLYGGRTHASMAFAEHLVRQYGDRVVLHPQDQLGSLPLADHVGHPEPDRKVYCCGPPPLLTAVEEMCADWPAGALRTERFVARASTARVREEPFEVELRRTGQTLTVPKDVSILDAVRGAGVGVISSCQQGTCGTCETTVLDGTPDHRDSLLADDERDRADCMFICVSRSCGPRLVLDL
jgi:ferredoxin-NADP reductase